MKHAEASHIDIQLMQTTHEVTLTVSDDGRGLKAAPTGAGSEGAGLQNIRERIAPYNGRLHIVSNGYNGTEVNVTLPL